MTTTRSLIFVGVAAVLLPGMLHAQATRNPGYLVDTYGNVVTSATSGVPVRSGESAPAREAGRGPDVLKKEAPASRTASASETPASPRAAPTSAPAPAKMQPQKINLSADALFAFNNSALKPEGKTMLDGLVRELKGAQYDSILVTGHTDRFGKTAYNQQLSERRANAVKAYLVSRDIPANRIKAVGMGKTQPVTKARDCPGGRTPKVFSCLQPDRRVDVEVIGTKGANPGSR